MDETVQVFKALSEEIRLRVLSLLMDGELCVCDLMAVLDLPQSTVSRHLAYLRNAGWVEGRRQGLWMYYRISEKMTPLHSELMHILVKRLSELDQVQTDHHRYLDYLKNRKRDRCD